MRNNRYSFTIVDDDNFTVKNIASCSACFHAWYTERGIKYPGDGLKAARNVLYVGARAAGSGDSFVAVIQATIEDRRTALVRKYAILKGHDQTATFQGLFGVFHGHVRNKRQCVSSIVWITSDELPMFYNLGYRSTGNSRREGVSTLLEVRKMFES